MGRSWGKFPHFWVRFGLNFDAFEVNFDTFGSDLGRIWFWGEFPHFWVCCSPRCSVRRRRASSLSCVANSFWCARRFSSAVSSFWNGQRRSVWSLRGHSGSGNGHWWSAAVSAGQHGLTRVRSVSRAARELRPSRSSAASLSGSSSSSSSFWGQKRRNWAKRRGFGEKPREFGQKTWEFGQKLREIQARNARNPRDPKKSHPPEKQENTPKSLQKPQNEPNPEENPPRNRPLWRNFPKIRSFGPKFELTLRKIPTFFTFFLTDVSTTAGPS